MTYLRAQDLYRLVRLQTAAAGGQCDNTFSHINFIIRTEGIGDGVTMVKPRATIGFHNVDSVAHEIEIVPVGLCSAHRIRIQPREIKSIFAGQPATITGGSIIDRPGPNQRVHDLVICP